MDTSDQPSWRRHIPVPEYRHLVMVFIIFGIILTCIILAGCTSKSLDNVYLLSLSYKAVDLSKPSTSVSTALASLGNSTSLRVRISFMSLCARLPLGDWTCSPSASNVANAIKEISVGQNASYDPLDLVNIAQTFKSDIIFEGLFFIALALNTISLCILFTSKAADDSEEPQIDDRKFRLSQLIAGILFFSAMMTLLSVFWQHVASSGAATLSEALTSGVVSGHVGSIAAGLGWTAVIINFLTWLAMMSKIACMGVLRDFYADAS